MLTVIAEFTRRCLATPMARSLKSDDVLACLTELFTAHGPPDHIRFDDGSEFTANADRDWLARMDLKTLFITPGSPWENGYNESFDGKLRDKLLNMEIFHTLEEAKVLARRAMAVSLQYGPPSQFAQLPTASTRNYLAAPSHVDLRYAPITATGRSNRPNSLITAGPPKSGRS